MSSNNLGGAYHLGTALSLVNVEMSYMEDEFNDDSAEKLFQEIVSADPEGGLNDAAIRLSASATLAAMSLILATKASDEEIDPMVAAAGVLSDVPVNMLHSKRRPREMFGLDYAPLVSTLLAMRVATLTGLQAPGEQYTPFVGQLVTVGETEYRNVCEILATMTATYLFLAAGEDRDRARKMLASIGSTLSDCENERDMENGDSGSE